MSDFSVADPEWLGRLCKMSVVLLQVEQKEENTNPRNINKKQIRWQNNRNNRPSQ